MSSAGGHINPAVTLGMFIARRISLLRGFCYVAVQCGGAAIASIILKGVSPPIRKRVAGIDKLRLAPPNMYLCLPSSKVDACFLTPKCYLHDWHSRGAQRWNWSLLRLLQSWWCCQSFENCALIAARPSWVQGCRRSIQSGQCIHRHIWRSCAGLRDYWHVSFLSNAATINPFIESLQGCPHSWGSLKHIWEVCSRKQYAWALQQI